LRDATIVDSGKLTESHQGLKNILPSTTKQTNGNDKKTVLLLGSGMVAGPLVEHLMSRPDIKIVVGKEESQTKIMFLVLINV
jgi:alpha-aminoadipic semialdehyde synthase